MWQTGLSSWHPQTRQPANHSLRTALSNQNLSFCTDFPFWNIQGPRRHSSLPLPEGWKSIAALPSAQTSPSKLRSTLHSIFNEALWILLIFLSSNGAASSFTDCLGAGLTAGQQQTFHLSSDQLATVLSGFCLLFLFFNAKTASFSKKLVQNLKAVSSLMVETVMIYTRVGVCSSVRAAGVVVLRVN